MCGDLLNSISRVFTKSDINEKPKEVPSVRVFSISSINPKIKSDATLYRIQSEINDKNSKVRIKELSDFIQTSYSKDLTKKMLVDKDSTVVSKMIQNLYVTSFGGLTSKSMKIYKITLIINATHDLPNIDNEKIEMLRIPLDPYFPSSMEGFLDDVVDKIQASAFKNISTLIYCYDGMRNSLVIVACYFIKYTDLTLQEIVQHLAFSRPGYKEEDGFGCYTEMVVEFARKHKKLGDSGIERNDDNLVKSDLAPELNDKNDKKSNIPKNVETKEKTKTKSDKAKKAQEKDRSKFTSKRAKDRTKRAKSGKDINKT